MAANKDHHAFLKLAKAHLARVQDSWDPPDWSLLGTFGLYCLEALIRASVLKDGNSPERTHWGKVNQAVDLTQRYGLPDIEDLLKNLNLLRKAEAYGDVDFDESDFDAEDMVNQIEQYFDDVTAFCGS